MQYPSITVIVPTYQRRDLVCDGVRSLSRSKYEGVVEIIVVVDGSTDGTAAALAKVDCPNRLRVIEQENRGLASARNRGAREASGDILLFLDDDMICQPDLLYQHALTHRAGAEAVIGEIPVHPASSPGLVTDALAKAAAWERKPPLSAFHVYGGHLSIRKWVFDEIGGFDEQLHGGGYGGEDLDFGLRLIGSYDVRHNTAAIAWQTNVISPREHMRRARQLAESDLRLIAKHPEVTTELLATRGAPSPTSRSLAFRMSRVPLLGSVAAQLAALMAEFVRPTPLRSNPTLSQFYLAARSMSYWSAVRRHVDAATLSEWLRL